MVKAFTIVYYSTKQCEKFRDISLTALCKVKWFRTYTEGAHPQPIYVSTTDASVYDLKDHPDFKFRPGSIVIRVMNTAGEDCGLGAGQVLDK